MYQYYIAFQFISFNCFHMLALEDTDHGNHKNDVGYFCSNKLQLILLEMACCVTNKWYIM